MHDNAHGLIPHQIIEVEANVVNAFLGRIEDPKSEKVLDETKQPIIDESAFRIIMYVCLKDIFVLKLTSDASTSSRIINSARNIIQKTLNRYEGREVIKDSKRVIISFTSAASAVMCALEIQNHITASLTKFTKSSFGVKIGLSAGIPVSGQNELFGETVELAKRLCDISNQEQIMISSEVREVYNNEILDGLTEDIPIQTITPDDEDFVNRLIDTTESIWNDPNFDVGVFGKQVGLSRSQFYRKVSSITGLSPNDFIKEFRLEKALSLIEKQQGNVAQIAFGVGFNSPSYFSKCFQKRFGVLPSILVSKAL
jgi:AraC-like DNA-binding protein